MGAWSVLLGLTDALQPKTWMLRGLCSVQSPGSLQLELLGWCPTSLGGTMAKLGSTSGLDESLGKARAVSGHPFCTHLGLGVFVLAMVDSSALGSLTQ